jgi:hypothetical protein
VHGGSFDQEQTPAWKQRTVMDLVWKITNRALVKFQAMTTVLAPKVVIFCSENAYMTYS